MNDQDDVRLYQVVVNAQLQYSIVPAEQEPPPGWLAEGTRGNRDECLARIAMVWADVRPRRHRVAAGPARI